MILLALYILMFFSDSIDDPKVKDYLGWIYLGALGLLIFIHLLYLVVDTHKKIKLRILRSYRICKYRVCNCKSKKAVKGPEAKNYKEFDSNSSPVEDIASLD